MHGNMGSICLKYCPRACLHGGGGPEIGEVTCGGSPHRSYKREQIKMRDYMDRRVAPPSWGRPAPSKQALNVSEVFRIWIPYLFILVKESGANQQQKVYIFLRPSILKVCERRAQLNRGSIFKLLLLRKTFHNAPRKGTTEMHIYNGN